MTDETLDELRERLLRQHNVQQMIQMRAYEIFQMRGNQPGGEALDWFHAEGEVLAFLIARESAREEEQPDSQPVQATPVSEAPLNAPATKKPRTRAAAKPSNTNQQAAKKTTTKAAATSKATETKPKPKRSRGQSRTEESAK